MGALLFSFLCAYKRLHDMKKTVVAGAGPEAHRYSHRAVVSLLKSGHEVIPVGLSEGEINGVTIRTDFPHIENVDTVSVYVHPRHHARWKEYILKLAPRRVIFNPGAESEATIATLEDAGIQCQESCTLVMLSVGTY